MKKSNNKGCFSGIIGTLLVIVGVVIYALLSSLINRIFIGMRFEDQNACALLNLTMISLTVAFVLYEVIFIVWQIKLSKGSDNKEDSRKTNKMFIWVFVGCVCASLLFAVISANTFTECREDSISKVCFVTTKEYRWDRERNDVLRYSLSCSPEGELNFNVTMKDGEVIDILGSVNSCSKQFINEYKNMYGYAAYLDSQFKQSEYYIESNISGTEYMEKYYKDAYPEIWEQISKIIEDHIDLPTEE